MLDRIHILEGRQLVLLNIDEVIAIIRQSDEPKAALIARFHLSDRQAEDILEIRLRQLARLKPSRSSRSCRNCAPRRCQARRNPGQPAALRRVMVKEIEADAKTFADAAAPLIQAEKKVVAEVKVVDEPVTVVVSEKAGCARAPATGTRRPALPSRPATACTAPSNAARSTPLLVFGNNGRVYSVAVSLLPGGRGDGQPITTLIELEAGTQIAHYFAGPARSHAAAGQQCWLRLHRQCGKTWCRARRPARPS